MAKSRRDKTTIAQRFIAGNATNATQSPGGTTEDEPFFRPYGTGLRERMTTPQR